METIKPLIRQVPLGSQVKDYIGRVVMATHPGNPESIEMVKKYVRYGSSPRGALAMALGAKARALLAGRYNVSFADVQAVAAPALRHRLILNFEGEADEVAPDKLISEILERVPPQDDAKLGLLARKLYQS